METHAGNYNITDCKIIEHMRALVLRKGDQQNKTMRSSFARAIILLYIRNDLNVQIIIGVYIA